MVKYRGVALAPDFTETSEILVRRCRAMQVNLLAGYDWKQLRPLPTYHRHAPLCLLLSLYTL